MAEKTYEIHPFAALLPMMQEKELTEMAEDIRLNGQRLSIIEVRGKVVDGRNRLEACRIAGVTPKTRDASSELLDDEAVAKFVFSINVARRHLTASERAVLASERIEVVLNKKKLVEVKNAMNAAGGNNTTGEEIPQTPEQIAADEQGKTELVKEIAEQANVSPAYVHQAEELKKKAPEKYEEVKKGEKTISEARKELKQDEAAADKKASKKDKKSDDSDDEEKTEKKAKKIVDRCLAELEKIGYTLVNSKIEKM